MTDNNKCVISKMEKVLGLKHGDFVVCWTDFNFILYLFLPVSYECAKLLWTVNTNIYVIISRYSSIMTHVMIYLFLSHV